MNRHFFTLCVALSLVLSGQVQAQTMIVPWDAKMACKKISTNAFSKFETLTIEHTDHSKIDFMVELADTYSKREQGLMCRTNLSDSRGMLFVFPDNSERSFWMKNTLIGLDIIYIDSKGKIISIQKNAQPLNTTPLPSHGKAIAVLEINAGLSDRLKIKVGDKIRHTYFKTRH